MDFTKYAVRSDADGSSSCPLTRVTPSNTIKEGDLFIIFERHDSLSFEYAKHGKIYQNKYGAFFHDDIIGKSFGSKIHSRKKGGWIYVLMPTPELWNQALRHRTQIVFTSDAAAICLHLDLRPGCIVVESGTGSGALTTALARAVAPHGHVYTFEFNETRAEIARDEFLVNGMADVVTIEHRDVCSDGFGDSLKGRADAVFLDLPSPWLAAEHAAFVLKDYGSICSYSPCIEQTQKFCEALRALKFQSESVCFGVRPSYYLLSTPLLELLVLSVAPIHFDAKKKSIVIKTIETRLKTYDVRNYEPVEPDFGGPTLHVPSSGGAFLP